MTNPEAWTPEERERRNTAAEAEQRRAKNYAYEVRIARPPVCETRIGKPDDLAFVVDCWTRYELRNGDGRKSHADLKRHARALLGVPNVPTHDMPAQLERLLIAHVPGEPDSILGWACVERGGLAYWPDGKPVIVDCNHVQRPPCLHYIYVRTVSRKLGVASALVGSRDIVLDYSHAAPKGMTVPKAWRLNMERAKT